jgi:ferredoxin-NADP reductase
MAHHILNHNIPHRDIYLIFGCRKFSDCLYRAELEDLSDKIDSFHYIPTFSREEAVAAEAGMERAIRTGYVHSVYEDICRGNLGAASDSTAPYPASFYLCGWKNMIDEAKQRIQALGFDRKAIHQELYG